jgi:beta-galactosidase
MAEQIRYGHYLHGGDYNPEQWLDRPDILKKDIEYFKKAHINTVSMGMFSWAVLEPEEGKYNFDWLEEVIDNPETVIKQIKNILIASNNEET